MKILHIGKYYPPYRGGMETHLQTLCEHTVKSYGIQVEVIVSNTGEASTREVINGVVVNRVKTPVKLSSAPISPEMVSLVRETPADIVHIHHPNPMAMFAYSMSGHKGRLVITYHSDVVRQKLLGPIFNAAVEPVMRKADAIIVTSDAYAASSPVLRRHLERCHTIPLGISQPASFVDNKQGADRVAEKFGSNIILSVGRQVYYKGFSYLIDAMRFNQGNLLLIGDGPLRPTLEKQVRRLGLTGRVHFLGNVDDMRPYFHAASVFALPSVARSEAFGIVQLEAMACGKPVVNTHLPSGVPFVSPNGETGLTVSPKDSRSLGLAIDALLTNETVRRTMGDSARRRASTLFNTETMSAKTLNVYEQVMKKRTATVSANSEVAQLVNRLAEKTTSL